MEGEDSNHILVVNFDQPGGAAAENRLIKAMLLREPSENITSAENLEWVLKTKYFEAPMKFRVADARPITDPETFVETHVTPETQAFVYYSRDIKELMDQDAFVKLMAHLQESSSPEMSALFYDGPAKSFSRKTDDKISELLYQGVEYITQDLAADIDNGKIKEASPSERGQSLLHSDNDKVGIDRLHEALQCCQWSSMQRVKVNQKPPAMLPVSTGTFMAPTSLVKPSEKQQSIEEVKVNSQVEEAKDGKSPGKASQDQIKPVSGGAADEEHASGKDLKEQEDKDQEAKQVKEISDLGYNPLQNELGTEPLNEEEQEAESMLALMEEVKNAQLRSKHLNDEDRRKNAEAVMMKLIDMMGVDDDDEDGVDYGDEETI